MRVTKKIRAFLAVPIPEDVRDRLSSLQRDLRPSLPNLRWVEPESIHLTLAFLGSILPAQTYEVLSALRTVARRREPVVCRVRGIGAFPSRQAATVLWAGVEPETKDLTTLAVDIRVALEPLGFPPERRAFRPHLTLARTHRGRVDVSMILERSRFLEEARDLGEILVDEVVLFRSEPGDYGSRYTALASTRLGREAMR